MKECWDYADVERSAIDGINREHAIIRWPKYIDKNRTVICRIHLPARSAEKFMEKRIAEQHTEIVALKQRIEYLENLYA